jgi:hypothetical protein
MLCAGLVQVVRFCQHGNMALDYRKCWKFLDELKVC